MKVNDDGLPEGRNGITLYAPVILWRGTKQTKILLCENMIIPLTLVFDIYFT